VYCLNQHNVQIIYLPLLNPLSLCVYLHTSTKTKKIELAFLNNEKNSKHIVRYMYFEIQILRNTKIRNLYRIFFVSSQHSRGLNSIVEVYGFKLHLNFLNYQGCHNAHNYNLFKIFKRVCVI